MEFSYYDGNIKKADCVGHISLGRFINAHKNPTVKTEKTIQAIKQAAYNDDLEQKKQLKQTLFAFTPSVYIMKGKPRRYSNIAGWTGLMQLDFDKIADAETALELKQYLFDTYKSIACIYISPSGRGVKALMRTTVPKDIEHYRALFKAVEKEMEQYGWFDSATKNAILPMFLSMDKEILSRVVSERWEKEDWSKTEYVRLNDIPAATYNDKDKQYFYDKVVRIVTHKINFIGGDGHPQLRNAALILGSRVGAGYIDKMEAEQLITNLICQNDYLKKDVKNYIKTALWAINQGCMNPKYF